jgi:hypothetical protein
MDPGLATRVIKFTAETVGVKESNIRLETTLLGDLGLTGDDAVDFFVSYAKTFEVDLSAFRCIDHFGPECGIGLFELIALMISPIWKPKKVDPHVAANKLPITVKDLIEAAEKKRWPEKTGAPTLG